MSLETQQAWPAPVQGRDGQSGSQDGYGPAAGTTYRRAAAESPAVADQPNGAVYDLASDKPRLPSLDPETPAEPQFSPEAWLETPSGSLADHPLLRGLLLELPPKGTTPPPGWLDRWFEATRSILELLYVK